MSALAHARACSRLLAWLCTRLAVRAPSSIVLTDARTLLPPGNTALHACCEEGRELVAVTLIENGAKLKTRNKDGRQPLELARPGLRATLRSLTTS